MREKRTQAIYIEDTAEPKYYARIPNMIDDLGLTVFAFRLYARIKRVAGDAGACWQSIDTLIAGCNMSAGSVVNARRELESRGLIRVEWVKNTGGGRNFPKVTIMNIWPDNIALYTPGADTQAILARYSRKVETTSPDELQASSPDEVDTSSPHELPSSPDEVASSCGEVKNNSINNNTLRKTTASLFLDNPTGAEVKNPAALRALTAFEERQAKGNGLDLASWPEEVRPYLDKFYSLWKRTPPQPVKGKRGGDFALWISELRALKTACAEFGPALLDDLFADWQDKTRKTGGEPFTLSRPGSLVKTAQAKAGEQRIKLDSKIYDNGADLQAGKEAVRDGYYQKWLACIRGKQPVPAFLERQAKIYKFSIPATTGDD